MEIAPNGAEEALVVESLHPVDHPVCRQDQQPLGMHIHERHHHPVRAFEAWILLPEGERRFVPVVAIGDQQFLIRHQRPDSLDGIRRRNLPYPV
jgi:hypothetical protein